MKKLPTRTALKALSIGAATLLVSLAAVSLPWHGDRPAEPPRTVSSARGSGPLRAGAAVVSVDLPPGTPIGGFTRRSYRAEGERDPITARALFLEVPGARVGIASVELLFVGEPLVRRVEALVADLKLDALLLGATHSHAGPGGWDDRLAFELGALGAYQPEAFERIAQATAEAVRRSVAGAAPARLAVAEGTAPQLVRSRSGGNADGRLLSLRLTSIRGEPLSELLVFAAHATTLGKENRRLSGDWPGRFLTSGGPGVRLFLQGPIGDQSAQVPPGDAATRPERYAAAVAAADDALAPSAPVGDALLATSEVSVTLPPPAPGAVPALLRRAVTTLAWSQVPATAFVRALRIGPVLLVAVPAEPTAALAARWRGVVGSDAAIVSLVGGYAGYVDDPDRTRRGEGEARRVYYGPGLAERLEDGVVAAVKAVSR